MAETDPATRAGARFPRQAYRTFAARGELRFQRCEQCGSPVFYPRVLCPQCASTALRWERSAGEGVVYATTVLYRRDEGPYNVALLDMAEGFRIMSTVEGIDPEDVRIGMPVIVTMRERDGEWVPIATPAAEG